MKFFLLIFLHIEKVNYISLMGNSGNQGLEPLETHILFLVWVLNLLQKS
ncbi:unnamed protein product [Spirodela intermedia]|uniref:Uncharacterized protein n=1 Tax=Spirodela intermedia TaxID=51605 RepID=A0A7I8JXC0_SPIIN|nr:unnamed protein product [Spirodela intermedia]